MIHDTEAQVCVDIRYRQQLGLKKYGTTVAGNPLPLRQWLQHAYEEVLDQAVYLKRAMQEIDEQDAIENAQYVPLTPAQRDKNRVLMREAVAEAAKMFGMEYERYKEKNDAGSENQS